MGKDPLFKIFKKHLELLDPETQGVPELVYEVVGEYMASLMEQGHIPHHMLDSLEMDLREEVLEIYRKVTYGHLNLKDYKKSQERKARSVKSS